MDKRAAGADRDTPLLHLLAAGESGSEALAMGLHIPDRTARWRLARLRDAGLIESPTRGTWTLTGAGQRAVLTTTIPEPTASIVVLDTLPTEHQAVLRLIEDAVIARRALYDVYPSNWPSFYLTGPAKSGKTLVGDLAARRFGLDPVAQRHLLLRETRGSLLGRRGQTGPAIWQTVPSKVSGPVITIDEFDKASTELREAAFVYLEGASRYQDEGVDLVIQTTAVVTLNDEGDLGLLPDSYLRRGVVIDTTPLRVATWDIDVVAAVLARVTLPVVSPDLAPPALALPDDARGDLRRLLLECLTERGWELVDLGPVAESGPSTTVAWWSACFGSNVADGALPVDVAGSAC